MKKQKAISLVALIITIVVLLILSVVAIREVTGQGIIAEAIKASFYQEMSALEEKKELSKLETFLQEQLNKENTAAFLGENVSVEEIKEFKETLKAEIIYVRNAFGQRDREITTNKVWKNNMFECQDIYLNEEYLVGLTKDIYYITKEVSGKEKVYIYDSVSDTCYKIPQTRIGMYIVHSLPYARFVIDGENAKDAVSIQMEVAIKEATDGTLSYEPDLNNFSFATQIIYYSEDFSKEYTIPVKEYVTQGKPLVQTIDGVKYTFANYTTTGTKVWANIKTTANGLDAYWVWIPRYAYKLDASVAKKEKSEIIFVDVNNKQMDGSDLPDGYTVHEAFKQQDGLKGIWFSKYDPSPVETVAIDKTEPGIPDLNNFNTQELKLIYYAEDGNSYIEKDYTENPVQIIEEKGATYYWYNYTNKIWANVKTTGNNLESWWVWIPRFAYKLESGTSKVILVDENNIPLDKETYGETLPTGYTLHEAFNQQDGLKGIWFSKYDPTPIETVQKDKINPALPDLNNFNTQELKLIYYTSDGNSYIERDYTANPSQTIEENETTYYWYDYPNKIWANIKTTGDNLDSWWVWIPRFAYKLESGTTSVILVNENDVPIDSVYGGVLPSGFTVHEAFKQEDGLKGIWFSKYDPSPVPDAIKTEK